MPLEKIAEFYRRGGIGRLVLSGYVLGDDFNEKRDVDGESARQCSIPGGPRAVESAHRTDGAEK